MRKKLSVSNQQNHPFTTGRSVAGAGRGRLLAAVCDDGRALFQREDVTRGMCFPPWPCIGGAPDCLCTYVVPRDA